MLPDLRLVAIAMLSTFVVSLCVGLFAASRLELEPIAVRAQPHAKVDDNIVERVSMSWTASERHRAAALRELADEMANLPAKAASPVAPAPETTARGQAAIAPKLPQTKAEESPTTRPVVSEPQTDLPPAVSARSATAPAVQATGNDTGNDQVRNTAIQREGLTADSKGTATETIVARTSDPKIAPAKANDAAALPNAGGEKPAALTAAEPATNESAPVSAAAARSDVAAATSIAASEKTEPKIAAPAPIAATEKSAATADGAVATTASALPKVAARAAATDGTDGAVDRPDAGTRKDELPIAMPDASNPLLQQLAPPLNKPIHRRRKPAVTPAFNGIEPLLPGQIGPSNGDVGAMPPFPFFNTQSHS